MADYVDRRMEIDAGRTRARLGTVNLRPAECVFNSQFVAVNPPASSLAFLKKQRSEGESGVGIFLIQGEALAGGGALLQRFIEQSQPFAHLPSAAQGFRQ